MYDATTSATIGSIALSGVIGGDSVAAAGGTAAFGDKNVGVGKSVTATGITLTGLDAGNYSVNAPAAASADITPLAITGAVTVADKVYDATTSAAITSSTLTGVLAGDNVGYGGGAATFADKNVGIGKSVTAAGLSLSGADAANYTVNSTAATFADITPLAIVGSITAADRVYDAGVGATIVTRSLTGVLGGDSVNVVGGTATFADKNVGSSKVVTATGLGLGGVDASNYTVNGTATASADITPLAITGTITAANKVYDGATAATIAGGTLTGVLAGDTVTIGGGTAAFADKNVGVAKTVTSSAVILAGADAGNYSINGTATTSADITPLAITGAVAVASKVYDATTGATIVGRSLTGVVAGDAVAYGGGAATFVDKNAGVAKSATATGLALSGVDAGNYTVNATANTVADITPLALTGSITAASRIYNGGVAATIAGRSVSGVLAGDSVSYAGGSATFADKNVGVGKSRHCDGPRPRRCGRGELHGQQCGDDNSEHIDVGNHRLHHRRQQGLRRRDCCDDRQRHAQWCGRRR